MTNLEALQSMLEYDNDNLLTKALIDRGVSESVTYSTAYQKSVELAAADIYLILCSYPEFKESSKYINYSKGALLALRHKILDKWGELPDTINTPGIGNQISNPPVW